MAAFGYTFRAETIPGFDMQWAWLLNSLWAVASANDLIIAMTLVYWLHRQRPEADERWDVQLLGSCGANDSILRRTVALVDKLITWTIGLPRQFSASS